MVVDPDVMTGNRERARRRPAFLDAAAADGEGLERRLHFHLLVAQLEPAHAPREAKRVKAEAEVVERPLGRYSVVW